MQEPLRIPEDKEGEGEDFITSLCGESSISTLTKCWLTKMSYDS